MTNKPTPPASLQADGATYAIVTRTPAGLVTPDDLERLAAIARRYDIPTVKLTSGQRFILAGIHRDDLENVAADLGDLGKARDGPCVKYVQSCLGTGSCRYGVQDSIAVGRMIEERFASRSFPAKVKMGVSGCQRCCAESQVRDIGLVGTNRGWTVYFGGNSGRRPRIGTEITRDLSTADALDCVRRLLEYYAANAMPQERTARFLERIGIDRLRSELLTLLPYIRLI